MKTETCKLYSRDFWIFPPNIIKIDPYNFELYCFKVGPFFETQCRMKYETYHISQNSLKKSERSPSQVLPPQRGAPMQHPCQDLLKQNLDKLHQRKGTSLFPVSKKYQLIFKQQCKGHSYCINKVIKCCQDFDDYLNIYLKIRRYRYLSIKQIQRISNE